MVKKIFFILTLVILSLLSSQAVDAQDNDWLWAARTGGPGYEGGFSVATDKDGNAIAIGNFSSSYISFGNQILYNAGGDDLFVVKYNSLGNVVWATSAGGASDEKGSGICTDTDGNIYLTGVFMSPEITFGDITLTNTDSTDIFIVKYSSDGDVVWAKSTGGNDHDLAQSIKTDANGNVYVAGSFKSNSITFGQYTIINSHNNYYDIFLVKYDPAGNVKWVNSASGNFSDRAYSVSCDSLGKVCLAGYFYSPSLSFGDQVIQNNGNYDYFLTQYDTTGNLIWARSGGGTEDDRGLATTVDSDGNVYITGSFTSQTIVLGDYTLTNADSTDMFLVKYAANGNIMWAKSAGGSDADEPAGITTGNDGRSVYITGNFRSSSITFGDITLNNTLAGYADIFAVRYDTYGNDLWAGKADGSSSDYAESIATDDAGNLFITGRFYSNILTFGTHSLYKNGWDDMFLVKHGPSFEGIWDTQGALTSSVYPNPTDNSARILYNLTCKDRVTIKIFDAAGKEIAVLCDDIQSHGQHEVFFDGSSLENGIYLYKISIGNQSATGKIMLVN
jgi:hypothetical protein